MHLSQLNSRKNSLQADDNAFLQLLLSNKVFLVEGATEFLLLPHFYKQITGKTIEDDGISVISCNGISYRNYLEIARVDTAVHCLTEWQAPVWVLTGFACYSARKSRSYHAGFRKCSYTCCACYPPFLMMASAISRMEIGGKRRLVCPKAKRTDGSQWRGSRSSRPLTASVRFATPTEFLHKMN